MEPLKIKLGKKDREVQIKAIAYLKKTYTYEQLTDPWKRWSLLKSYTRETGVILSLGDAIGVFTGIKDDTVIL